MRLRPPTPSDAEAVLAVVVARDIVDLGRPDYTLEDVKTEWEAPGTDPARDCVVAEDADGSIVGYAIIDRRAFTVLVHPDAQGRGIGTLLREAMEARASERGEQARQTVAAANAEAIEHLTKAGYHRVHVYLRMRGDLAAAPAAPAQPSVRPFDLEREGPVIHALVEEAFAEIEGNVPEPFEGWQAYVGKKTEPGYRLAIDDEKGLAGVAMSERWEDGVGYVGILAVARRARGRGYGRALLLAAFGAFRADGLTSAELSVQGANAPATRLYESVGMAEAWQGERWER